MKRVLNTLRAMLVEAERGNLPSYFVVFLRITLIGLIILLAFLFGWLCLRAIGAWWDGVIGSYVLLFVCIIGIYGVKKEKTYAELALGVPILILGAMVVLTTSIATAFASSILLFLTAYFVAGALERLLRK